LVGGAGGDLLDGGTGADTMRGGLGRDTYIVDDDGDLVDETGGDGVDTVLTSLNSYSMPTDVENLTFTGTGNFRGDGNELANVISGGAGNDTLDGGAGNDTLDGGLGDDTYIVDSAGDFIRDSGGIDRVFSLASTYTLGANLEHLYYAGLGDFIGTGNNLANEISGGSGNDLLSGLGGADTIGGNDGNDTLLGGAGNDSLFGGQGDDVLVGGLGRDVLNGGPGADIFRFETLTDTRTGANADVIVGFAVGEDRIDVSAIDPDAILEGDQSYAFIGSAAFSANPGKAEVRFVHSGGNTLVHFDNDGNGTIDMSIVVNGIHALSAAEFIL
ncbi:MAG TPA: calcium-binding protein, partial [Novosphingobium sp.]|nr:calcium-binding protein [Novosphingobium sp.]